MKKLDAFLVCLFLVIAGHAQSFVTDTPGREVFSLNDAVICVDPADEELVRHAALLLQQDLEMVTGRKLPIVSKLPARAAIVIGSIGHSLLITSAIKKGIISQKNLEGKWEKFHIRSTNDKIYIAGSDRRGTAYGVLEFSKQAGVSPWYWWADVPVVKRKELFIIRHVNVFDAPKVKYRGIFLNDEAPALSGWTKEKFGGFNHSFYEKVFELILRLKGNYLWPAMWGNKFYDDDTLNIKMADRYGIVIGTSHHEPLMRAHDEWRKYGTGKWNYDSNAANLRKFWRAGMVRATNEKIVSIGMRGDGDEPMSRETATALLERIVNDQRKIITEVTGKPASETPQLWALYKEVQDYYDKGMRVPDDVTLLLCDDNWGNLRKLPKKNDPPRKGGYGIYYHFDYVGGPRNYKWLNTNPLPRVWEQMHLAWQYNVRDIWIVNVGDLKPMELPISFFLDYAWNPDAIGPAGIRSYTEHWAAQQFGDEHAAEISRVLSAYAKLNSRCKPELLDANTYDLATGEWPAVVKEFTELVAAAEKIAPQLDPSTQDAYFQLVLHPVQACANLNQLYYYVALNKEAFIKKWPAANAYADSAKAAYTNDSLITIRYHQLNGGKWNHMMSQTHIGYTNWQQPEWQKMPELKYLDNNSETGGPSETKKDVISANVPDASAANSFYQLENVGVSIAADHFTRSVVGDSVKWTLLPDHGRTGSAITAFPVTMAPTAVSATSPHLEYEIYTYAGGECTVNTYHSPTLNLFSAPEGLNYAISIDDETPQVISINKEDKNSISGIWNKWVSENIIIKQSRHRLSSAGKHVVKYWLVDPGVVLQKIVIDFGDTEKNYLGPTETINAKLNN